MSFVIFFTLHKPIILTGVCKPFTSTVVNKNKAMKSFAEYTLPTAIRNKT